LRAHQDRERAADAETALEERAGFVGHGARGGAGIDVYDGDSRTSDRLAGSVDHFAAQRGRSDLGVNRRNRSQRQERSSRSAVAEFLEDRHFRSVPLNRPG